MGYKYKFWTFPGRQKPTRERLGGKSCSEFKTLLKRNGFKLPRQFFKYGSIATKMGRKYRFRWWMSDGYDDGFVVDVSCQLRDFDRWSNSVDEVVTWEEFMTRGMK